MRALPRLFCFVAVSVSVASTGCSATTDDETTTRESEGELRALKKAEIVGGLGFGETSAAVEYTDTPLYRAFKVGAVAGDVIDAWVRSDTGDARAWILSPSFGTLALNDDADASTRDAHVKKSVTKAGTYYVAFRDANREDNTFTVSLAAKSGGGNNGGGNTGVKVDPFDDALLSGTPITPAEARNLFAAGSSTTSLGNFAMAQRTRSCNTTTGCAAWGRNDGITFAYLNYELWNPGPGWSNQKACFQFGTSVYSSLTGSMSLSVTASGQFALAFTSDATGGVTCSNVTAGKATCDNLSSSGASPSVGPTCTLPNRMGSGFEPTVYPASVPLYTAGHTEGSPLSFSVLVTRDHVYARSTTRGDADKSGNSTEVEYALYGLMQPGATPRL